MTDFSNLLTQQRDKITQILNRKAPPSQDIAKAQFRLMGGVPYAESVAGMESRDLGKAKAGYDLAADERNYAMQERRAGLAERQIDLQEAELFLKNAAAKAKTAGEEGKQFLEYLKLYEDVGPQNLAKLTVEARRALKSGESQDMASAFGMAAQKLGIEAPDDTEYDDANIQIGEDIVSGRVNKKTGVRQIRTESGWQDAPPEAQVTTKTVTQGGRPETEGAPTGYRWSGDNLEPIPGGPATKQTPEQAAKTAMVEVAKDSYNRAFNIIAPNGEIDRATLAAMQANVPGTDGRTARALFHDAIEAKLRAESGAAVPQTEVDRIGKRLLPSVLDKDTTIFTKKILMERFINSTLSRIENKTLKYGDVDLADVIPSLTRNELLNFDMSVLETEEEQDAMEKALRKISG